MGLPGEAMSPNISYLHYIELKWFWEYTTLPAVASQCFRSSANKLGDLTYLFWGIRAHVRCIVRQSRRATIPVMLLRALAKASGLLDPASPSGVSEEDENFTFPLTPPSEPAAPAAVFSSWHSFRKRSSKVCLCLCRQS